MHQVRALVSCIQPGLVICFTLDNIHVSMLFSRNIPPLSSFFSLSLSVPFCEMGVTAAPASSGFKLVTVESCSCSAQTTQKSLTIVIVIISTSLLSNKPCFSIPAVPSGRTAKTTSIHSCIPPLSSQQPGKRPAGGVQPWPGPSLPPISEG